MKRKIDLMILAAFLLLVYVPVLTINHVPGKISKVENRTLASFPDILDDNYHLNDGVKSGLENWLNDNIGFRDQFVQTASKVKFSVFGIKSNNKVYAGKDGWYFYTMDNNIQIAQGTYPLDQITLEAIRVNQEAINQRFKDQGIEYILVLPVSKASIYPEMIQAGKYEVRETPVDIVANYLEATTDIKIVRLKDALLEKKKEEDVFFKTDTHWNEVGAYTAYKTIINKMNNWNLHENEPIEVEFQDMYRKGEFSAMLGNTNLLPEEKYKSIVIENPCATHLSDSLIEYSRIYEIKKSEELTYNQYLYKNNAVNEAKVVMYGEQ